MRGFPPTWIKTVLAGISPLLPGDPHYPKPRQTLYINLVSFPVLSQIKPQAPFIIEKSTDPYCRALGSYPLISASALAGVGLYLKPRQSDCLSPLPLSLWTFLVARLGLALEASLLIAHWCISWIFTTPRVGPPLDFSSRLVSGALGVPSNSIVWPSWSTNCSMRTSRDSLVWKACLG